MTIDEQRRHPKWQRKRLEVLADKGWTCEICKDTESPLNVHHLFYRPGALYWEYESDEFKSLCEDCHTLIHRLRPNSSQLLFLKRMTQMFKEAEEAING